MREKKHNRHAEWLASLKTSFTIDRIWTEGLKETETYFFKNLKKKKFPTAKGLTQIMMRLTQIKINCKGINTNHDGINTTHDGINTNLKSFTRAYCELYIFHSTTLPPRHNAAILSLQWHYFHGKCSDEFYSSVPPISNVPVDNMPYCVHRVEPLSHPLHFICKEEVQLTQFSMKNRCLVEHTTAALLPQTLQY